MGPQSLSDTLSCMHFSHYRAYPPLPPSGLRSIQPPIIIPPIPTIPFYRIIRKTHIVVITQLIRVTLALQEVTHRTHFIAPSFTGAAADGGER